jgi:hypothetical protein
VYVRRIDSTELHLQASGSLWRDALVLHDRETGTLWSQVTGEAIGGAHMSRRLERYPSTLTTFAEFVREYPQGRILAKPEGAEGSPYAGYYANSERMGIFGTQNPDEKLDGKSKVIGLTVGYDAVAVPLSQSGHPLAIIETVGEERLLAYWDPDTHTAAVYHAPPARDSGDVRAVASDPHTLQSADGTMAWDALTGELKVGEGAPLQPAPFLISYWFAWRNFYPHTRIVEVP